MTIPDTGSLFGETGPLAARMRPATLDEFLGQDHVLAGGRVLRRAIERDRLTSLILAGPPGSGKTTLARLIARRTNGHFEALNAVLSGVADVRRVIADARSRRDAQNRTTILFVDEVHRWNKSQQDALLPWVEEGLVTLVGATTHNPWFDVNAALLSRSTVFRFRPLGDSDLHLLVDRVLTDTDRGYGRLAIEIAGDARAHLVRSARGDARRLLNALELAIESSLGAHDQQTGPVLIPLATAEESIQQAAIRYDRDGDDHYDTLSALIKSIRGSDPDAAVYWLARMIVAGEDPRSIFRRLLVLAAEDVGLADPAAVTIVESLARAFDRVGMPEGEYLIAEAALYLATTEKSNSVAAYFAARDEVEGGLDGGVPRHLMDAARDGEALGHGDGYRYPHDAPGHWLPQRYLPGTLENRAFFHPGEIGWEGERRQQIIERRRRQASLDHEYEDEYSVVLPSTTAAWYRRAERAVRDSAREVVRVVMDALHLSAESRVLLHGHAIRVLVDPVSARVPGGVVVAWTGHPAVEAIRSVAPAPGREPVEAEETGLLRRPEGAPSGSYRGPFDAVCIRTTGRVPSPDAVARFTEGLLAPGGSLVVVMVDCENGTRPSEVLRDSAGIEPAVYEDLVRAETSVCGGTIAAWRSLETSGATVATADEHLRRRIDGETVATWFRDESPLAAALREAAAVASLRKARAITRDLTPFEVDWTRRYLVVTTPRDA